jgi:hypothetical protein
MERHGKEWKLHDMAYLRTTWKWCGNGMSWKGMEMEWHSMA